MDTEVGGAIVQALVASCDRALRVFVSYMVKRLENEDLWMGCVEYGGNSVVVREASSGFGNSKWSTKAFDSRDGRSQEGDNIRGGDNIWKQCIQGMDFKTRTIKMPMKINKNLRVFR